MLPYAVRSPAPAPAAPHHTPAGTARPPPRACRSALLPVSAAGLHLHIHIHEERGQWGKRCPCLLDTNRVISQGVRACVHTESSAGKGMPGRGGTTCTCASQWKVGRDSVRGQCRGTAGRDNMGDSEAGQCGGDSEVGQRVDSAGDSMAGSRGGRVQRQSRAGVGQPGSSGGPLGGLWAVSASPGGLPGGEPRSPPGDPSSRDFRAYFVCLGLINSSADPPHGVEFSALPAQSFQRDKGPKGPLRGARGRVLDLLQQPSLTSPQAEGDPSGPRGQRGEARP